MKKWKKYVTAALAAMVCASVLAGCGGGAKKEEAKEIKIGASFELTGNVAMYGKNILSGVKMSMDEANAKGGVLGKKIVIIESDNKSEPSESGNSITKLVTQDKVVAVVGPATSGCVAAGSPITEANKIPHIAPSGTAPGLTVANDGKVKPFMFRACFIDPFQGQVMATFANNTLKAKNIAILKDSSSDYSKGLATFFKDNFLKNGCEVVAEEAYLQKDTDFKSTLTKVKAANPDFIYVPGYYQEVGLIIKQAREIGLNIAIAGGDGWDSAKLPEIAGKEALNGTFFCNLYSPDDTSDLNKNFVAEYQKMYNSKPDVFAALAHDSAMAIVKGIEDAKSADPAKVAAAVAKIKDLQGVSGALTFDDKHNPIKSAVIIEHIDGKQTFKTKINP
mgnify:CR=1 FL=1